jgi:hypothetical protein
MSISHSHSDSLKPAVLWVSRPFEASASFLIHAPHIIHLQITAPWMIMLKCHCDATVK